MNENHTERQFIPYNTFFTHRLLITKILFIFSLDNEQNFHLQYFQVVDVHPIIMYKRKGTG